LSLNPKDTLKQLGDSPFIESYHGLNLEDPILTENTMEQYLAVFETAVNRMIPLISKTHDNEDFLLSGLLLDDVPRKDFDSKRV
jgi:hypothetical protein